MRVYRMIDCTLVTCDQVPVLDPDDRLLLQELRGRGLAVSVESWTDPSVDWAASRLCIVRSTWDYHSRYRDFLAWIDGVAALTALKNEPHLLRWNMHKSYLRELELRGVPIVPTAWLSQGKVVDVGRISDERGWGNHDLVVKPARGAAAHDVLQVRRGSLAVGQAHASRLLQTQDVLVQPYLPGVVTYGERALIFIRGRYSHAVIKKPFDRLLAIRSSTASRVQPTVQEFEVAAKAVAALSGQTIYARVDLLRDEDGIVFVSELELIEPALYFGVYEPARFAFADAVERELDEIGKVAAGAIS